MRHLLLTPYPELSLPLTVSSPIILLGCADHNDAPRPCELSSMSMSEQCELCLKFEEKE